MYWGSWPREREREGCGGRETKISLEFFLFPLFLFFFALLLAAVREQVRVGLKKKKGSFSFVSLFSLFSSPSSLPGLRRRLHRRSLASFSRAPCRRSPTSAVASRVPWPSLPSRRRSGSSAAPRRAAGAGAFSAFLAAAAASTTTMTTKTGRLFAAAPGAPWGGTLRRSRPRACGCW